MSCHSRPQSRIRVREAAGKLGNTGSPSGDATFEGFVTAGEVGGGVTAGAAASAFGCAGIAGLGACDGTRALVLRAAGVVRFFSLGEGRAGRGVGAGFATLFSSAGAAGAPSRAAIDAINAHAMARTLLARSRGLDGNGLPSLICPHELIGPEIGRSRDQRPARPMRSVRPGSTICVIRGSATSRSARRRSCRGRRSRRPQRDRAAPPPSRIQIRRAGLMSR